MRQQPCFVFGCPERGKPNVRTDPTVPGYAPVYICPVHLLRATVKDGWLLKIRRHE